MSEPQLPRAVHESAVVRLAPLQDETPSERPRADYRPTIRELPSSERPRERLRSYGEGALSTAELLAIILRVGIAGENVLDVASRLLSQHGGLVGLARLNFDEWKWTLSHRRAADSR